MISTRIIFRTDGPILDFTTPVEGFACTVQNTMVNVGTDKGSDPCYPDRGTDLRKDAAEGRMTTVGWASQAANFAALDALAFSRYTERQSNPSKLQKFELQCVRLQAQAVTLAARATSTDGQVAGVLADL